jgi:hypothetical protein
MIMNNEKASTLRKYRQVFCLLYRDAALSNLEDYGDHVFVLVTPRGIQMLTFLLLKKLSVAALNRGSNTGPSNISLRGMLPASLITRASLRSELGI